MYSVQVADHETIELCPLQVFCLQKNQDSKKTLVRNSCTVAQIVAKYFCENRFVNFL